MSVKRHKGRFYSKLPDDSFLNVTIWPGKSTPNSEIIVVEIRKNKGDHDWETVTRLAIFRTPEGKYVHLPERRNQTN